MNLTPQYALKNDMTQITSRIISMQWHAQREPAPIYTMGADQVTRRGKRYIVVGMRFPKNRHADAAVEKLKAENEPIQIALYEELSFEHDGHSYKMNNWTYINHNDVSNNEVLLYLRCDTCDVDGEKYDMARLIAARLQGGGI